MLLFRLLKIIAVALCFGLDEFLRGQSRIGGPLAALRVVLFWRDFPAPRAVRLRMALEALGPIFVKFGQILSTRRDLLQDDIAAELAKLQDQVPPFPGDEAITVIERAQGKPLAKIFKSFDRVALASASVAQVHLAELHDGREAAVKILRPGIAGVIRNDLALKTGELVVRVGEAQQRADIVDKATDIIEKMLDDIMAIPVATGRDGSLHHSLQEPGYRREPARPAISMASRLWQAVTPEPH